MDNNGKDEIKRACIHRWEAELSDDRIRYFWDSYDEFFVNLTDEMRRCVELLLREFDYYPQKVVNRDFVRLHNELIDKYEIDLNYTIFTVLKSQNKRYNSSYDSVCEYKNLNGVSKYIVIPELQDFFAQEFWPNINNVVFIDDFCGSGKTFLDYLQIVMDSIKDKNIYYVVIHSMQEAIDKICLFAQNNGLNVRVVSGHVSDAAFSINEELRKEKDAFVKASKELGIKPYEILGEYDTESLVAFFRNTPNNTLGLFMKNTQNNKAIFPRKIDPMPDFMRIKEKKKRNDVNNYVCRSKAKNR